jgi:hypothetical protein
MANVSLTLTVSEAEAARIEKALCESEGLAITGPNTKAVVIQLIKLRVRAWENQKKAEEATEAPAVGGIT